MSTPAAPRWKRRSPANRNVLAAKPPDIGAFERQFFNHMILALDHYFGHRGRTMEGKDGKPLNEVRMPVRRDHGKPGPDERDQDDSLRAGNLDPEARARRPDTAECRRSRPVLDEIEKKYP
jgi:hypothetical protein